MRETKIFFIHASKCPSCQKTLKDIEKAIKKSEVECDILKFESTSDAALGIAVTHNIDDLPGFVISPAMRVFKGRNYSEEEIVKALKKADRIAKSS
jgi:hypothetical protein